MFWAILLLLLTVFVIYIFLTISGKYSFPPGPVAWPIIGNALNVNTSKRKVFSELARKYGGLFSLKFFDERFIVLSDLELIQKISKPEQISSKTFSSRPTTFVSGFTCLGRTLPYLEAGDKWKSRRELLSKRISVYTDGIQLSESILRQELGHVIEWIGSHKAEPVDLSPILLASVVNTIAVLLLGKRFEHHGEEIKSACDVITYTERLSDLRTDAILKFLPCLRKIPILYGSTYSHLQKSLELIKKYFYIKPKEESGTSSSRGLLDLLLKAKEGNNNNINKGGVELSDNDVIDVMNDFVAISVPKIHATLLNFIWMTIQKPAVALKIQREVEKVTDSTRAPTLRDRVRMPYTEAVILELLRFTCPVGFTRHRVNNDTIIAEYQIPSNSTILVDVQAVNRDPTIWTDPQKFMPERFLTDTGKLVSENSPIRKNLASFGAGTRKCIGQAFVVSRLFLYIATLLQQFNFRQPGGETTLPSDDALIYTGNTVKPPCFKVKVFPHQCNLKYYTQKSSP